MDKPFIGLMSGTSMDGIDGVLARFAPRLQVLAHAHVPLPAGFVAEALALNQPGANELHRAALLANALAEQQAQLVERLLAGAGLDAAAVAAIGSHGQTVRHRPGEFDGTGYTLQVNQPALLAERTGIDVIADFRARDIAAGGQGAPLVPAFHAAVFGAAHVPRAVLNLGGIANLSLLAPGRDAAPATLRAGFDSGPANLLMDGWCQRHLGAACDVDGRWAAGGRVDAALLARLLAEPYFHQPGPKSTGRDRFHLGWLDAHLAALAGPAPAPQDVQATLLELTARTATDALRAEAPATRELLVCGGGAFNAALMARIAALWPEGPVASTATAGLPPDQVEATAFAWLAWRFTQGLPGNDPVATGARGPRVLGARYPA